MTKPLGFYTSYTPGDGGLLERLQEQWGAHFQQLTNEERAWMIYQLGYDLWSDTEGESIRLEVEEAIKLIRPETSYSNKLGLIHALVEQMKGNP